MIHELSINGHCYAEKRFSLLLYPYHDSAKNKGMEERERELLQSINRVLQDPRVISMIDETADRIEQKFQASGELLAWEPVPLEAYGHSLPEIIRSSWVFLLREGSASGAERHPNSHQRVRSWRRTGDLQVWIEDHWESHILRDRFDVPMEEQWASIPINFWHQAVVSPGEHWIVVSFHTACSNDLIEERPDPNDASIMRQRVYVRAQS